MFKNASGLFYTKSLFYETASDKSAVVYTLKEADHEGYPSLYRLYMETDDPTEWTFAVRHLGGWSHFEVLLECNWFKPYIEAWRKELHLRMKAQALANIRELAKTRGKESFVANRYLVDKGWDAPKKGRPTKSDISQRAHDIAEARQRLSQDAERLQLQ